MKKGAEVTITAGPYKGEVAVISFLAKNGAMVKRDSTEERRFCMVKFEHLKLVPEKAKK